MTVADDLAPLRAAPFKAAVDKFEQLMTQSGRVFLLGAGCSKCAGLPLTAQLTSEVLLSSKLSAESKAILQAIRTRFDGAPLQNVEDYLSELVDLLAIAERRHSRGATAHHTDLAGKSCSVDDLRKTIEQIKDAIATLIDKQVSVSTHWEFVKAVHRPLRPGRPTRRHRVEYLVLNYDTLIEDALALERVPFADGLDGGVTGWWNPKTFADERLSARVMKLHGSINWYQFPSESLPRRVARTLSGTPVDDRRIVIWPASTKYRETQHDPYAQLSALAREVLRPSDGTQCVLAVCGYSFNDSHINSELDKALRESRDLTVLIFWPENDLSGIVKAWAEDSAVREQLVVYGKSGFWHGDACESSTVDLPWWKFEVVTRLLGGER